MTFQEEDGQLGRLSTFSVSRGVDCLTYHYSVYQVLIYMMMFTRYYQSASHVDGDFVRSTLYCGVPRCKDRRLLGKYRDTLTLLCSMSRSPKTAPARLQRWEHSCHPGSWRLAFALITSFSPPRLLLDPESPGGIPHANLEAPWAKERTHRISEGPKWTRDRPGPVLSARRSSLSEDFVLDSSRPGQSGQRAGMKMK